MTQKTIHECREVWRIAKLEIERILLEAERNTGLIASDTMVVIHNADREPRVNVAPRLG